MTRLQEFKLYLLLVSHNTGVLSCLMDMKIASVSMSIASFLTFLAWCYFMFKDK